jgi:hypothetical protein
MNKNLKILEFLLKENFISENYLATVIDICVRQAKAQIEKEYDCYIDLNELREILERWG